MEGFPKGFAEFQSLVGRLGTMSKDKVEIACWKFQSLVGRLGTVNKDTEGICPALSFNPS